MTNVRTNDPPNRTDVHSRKYVVSAMKYRAKENAVPIAAPFYSAQSVPQQQNSSLIPAKDCFSKKDLIDILTRVQTGLQDKWQKIAETPPRSVAVYEDINLVRTIIEQLKA